MAAGVLGLALAATPAHPCDSSSCALLTRGQTGLLARGAFQLDFSFRSSDYDTKLQGSGTVDVVPKPKLDLENGRVYPAVHQDESGRESFLHADVAYGLSSRVTLYGSIPVLARRDYDIGHFGFEQRYRVDGTGDLLVGARYGPSRALALGLALKLPVGPYRLAGDYDGSILDPMLQPGSGSLDLVGSVQIARPAWGLNWSLAGSYQRTTANELEYRFGDEVIATLSAGRVVAGALSASLQAKWIHKARSEFHGEGVPSTGYTFGYLVPGIRLALPGQTAFYGFFHVAVHRHVNDAQLAPSAAFLLGFSKTL